MPPELINAFLQGGAITTLAWVILMLVTGKLHTNSEIDGLRKDKQDLLDVNEKLAEGLKQANELLRYAVERR